MRLKLRRPFYGWWVLVGGMGIQAVNGALVFSAYGSYLLPLQADLGWSKATIAAASSLQQVEGALLGPIQGWIIDRLGARAVVRVGLVILGIGFFLWSQSQDVFTFYLTYFLMAVGASLAGYLSLSASLVHWFIRLRATTMGLLSTGFSIGTALLVPAVAFSLDQVGWRTTAIISGLLVLAFGLPCAQLLRTRPEDHGLRPDGDTRDSTRPAEGLAPAKTFGIGDLDYTAREAIRTWAFWMLAIGHAAALLVVSTVSVHLVAHVSEVMSVSLQLAATAVTVITIASVVGQIVGGLLGDRYDKRFISFGCLVCHAVALLLLAYADTVWAIGISAVMHGIAWGVRGPMMAAIRADYFGRRAFATILGTSVVVANAGSFAGPLLAGYFYDQFGNYQLGFTVVAVIAGLGSLFFLFAPKPAPPKGKPALTGTLPAAQTA